MPDAGATRPSMRDLGPSIENVNAAIDQIAQTTLRKVVGQHTLDETLAETDRINVDIREILDVTTTDWGVEVTLVELKDIQLPDSMKRAMARQAEAEREKRAKIIDAEGESMAAAALGDASDTMMAHPLALQLRNLQTLIEIGVDKNTTVVFPAPLMSTIGELGSFLAREATAARMPQAPSDIQALTAAVSIAQWHLRHRRYEIEPVDVRGRVTGAAKPIRLPVRVCRHARRFAGVGPGAIRSIVSTVDRCAPERSRRAANRTWKERPWPTTSN